MKDSTKTNNANTTTEIAIREREVLIKDLGLLDKQATSYKITDVASREQGTVILKSIKDMQKTAEEKRKSLVDPLNKVVSAINAEFKKISDPLKRLEVIVKNEISRDYREQEEKRIKAEIEANKKLEAERKRLEKEMLKAKDDVLTQELIQHKIDNAEIKADQKVDAVRETKTVTTTFGQTTVRKIWTWELLNIADVPLEYLKVDEAKITTVVRAGTKEIKGIRIFEKESVSVR